MTYTLADTYIGNFPITQAFGARPEVYMARYNMRGHNGIDIGCPSLTPVLATANGFVSEIGFDAGGYGNYVKVVHDGFLSLYGHLNDITVKKGDHVTARQLIAHSNNSGFSDAPHLHFGVALCDAAGNKTDPNNGFSGYIDPMSAPFVWDIQNPTAPVMASVDTAEPIKVDPTDFTNMVSEGSSFKVIATFLISKGLNTYLSSVGKPLVDLTSKTSDPTNGEKIVTYLSSLLDEVQTLQDGNRNLAADLQSLRQNTATVTVGPNSVLSGSPTPADVQSLLQNVTEAKKNAFLSDILISVRNFIFTQK